MNIILTCNIYQDRLVVGTNYVTWHLMEAYFVLWGPLSSSKLRRNFNFVETSSKLRRAGELISQGIYYEKIRGYAYLSLTEKYIIYEDNSETRFYIQNIYLTCKLHIKLTFSWKPWNDHTVITVILPPALWSKYRKMKSLYIRPYKK